MLGIIAQYRLVAADSEHLTAEERKVVAVALHNFLSLKEGRDGQAQEERLIPPMLAFSKLRKAFKIPSGFRGNQDALRRSSVVSVERVSLDPEPNPQLGLRFCIWVALKFEDLHTEESCDLVSEILYTNNWFSLYWEALELLKKSGVLITSESIRALIRSYSLMGLTEKAVETFGRMHELDCKPDIHTYNTILKAVLRKELFLLAFAVYSMVLKSNCCPDEYTYNMLIDGFCKSGDIEGALETLTDMDQSDTLPDIITFTTIMSGLCQMKKVDEANRLFNVMKERGCQPDLISYNVLINGFCKQGRLDEAVSFLQLIERDGYDLQLNGYSSLIDGLFRARRYNEAHLLYTRMLKEGIMPDVVLYTIMIRGFSKEGRVGEAVKMLDEMTQSGLIPDAYCYNAVIRGFCDIGLLDRARSLHLEISENDGFHNTCTHTIIICDMCKRGMVREAQEIFNQMENLGCFPSVVTFNALINGLCKAGKLQEANLLFYKMEIGRSPSLFFRLSQGSDRVFDGVSLQKKMEQMCEAGQILNAYKFLTQLADSGVVPDIMTYNILINGFCKSGNISGAFKLFKDLQLKGLSPDSVTYGTLIDGLYRVDREEDAFKIHEHMLKNGCKPSFSVYRVLMTWLCRKRKISMAFSLYMEYLKNVAGRDSDSINALNEHFVRGEVEQTIRGLLKLDFRFREFDVAPYTILLIGFCLANKLDEALIIFSVLDEFNININPTSCVHLISGLCVEGKLDNAVDIFLYSLDKGFMLRQKICKQLLKHLLDSQDKKDYAIDLVGRMNSVGYPLKKYHSCMAVSSSTLLPLLPPVFGNLMAPLLIGCDVRNMTAETLEILSNKEIAATHLESTEGKFKLLEKMVAVRFIVVMLHISNGVYLHLHLGFRLL
ncbi:Tetratricopeptide-like helical domain superfamily [Sesbania bispinosa]|nr:Tetratricopeptide-like helical domain superfamily [Sesbania bispinosa]